MVGGHDGQVHANGSIGRPDRRRFQTIGSSDLPPASGTLDFQIRLRHPSPEHPDPLWTSHSSHVSCDGLKRVEPRLDRPHRLG